MEYSLEELQKMGAKPEEQEEFSIEDLQKMGAKPVEEKGLISFDGPKQSLWEAIKGEFTKPLDPSAKAALSNPLMSGFSPAVSGAVGIAGKGLVNAAERFATSPLPKKISDATNVVGGTKGLLGKIGDAVGAKLPDKASKAIDLVTGLLGRKGAYTNPLTGVPQGISDAAKGVQGAQKGVAWLLDNAPQTLGKYGARLQEAAKQGPGALAALDILMQKQDPQYMKLRQEVAQQEP